MPELFFEDFVAGDPLPEARLTVETEDAAYFSETFAPGVREPSQPPDSLVPLAEWHVAALGMRLLFASFVGRTASMGGPGIERVTWPHPVRVGDDLVFTGRVEATRRSVTRHSMGLVTVAFRIANQNGLVVMTQDNVLMVEMRGTEG